MNYFCTKSRIRCSVLEHKNSGASSIYLPTPPANILIPYFLRLPIPSFTSFLLKQHSSSFSLRTLINFILSMLDGRLERRKTPEQQQGKLKHKKGMNGLPVGFQCNDNSKWLCSSLWIAPCISRCKSIAHSRGITSMWHYECAVFTRLRSVTLHAPIHKNRKV